MFLAGVCVLPSSFTAHRGIKIELLPPPTSPHCRVLLAADAVTAAISHYPLDTTGANTASCCTRARRVTVYNRIGSSIAAPGVSVAINLVDTEKEFAIGKWLPCCRDRGHIYSMLFINRFSEGGNM